MKMFLCSVIQIITKQPCARDMGWGQSKIMLKKKKLAVVLQEAESDRSLWVGCQPGLPSEFQDSPVLQRNSVSKKRKIILYSKKVKIYYQTESDFNEPKCTKLHSGGTQWIQQTESLVPISWSHEAQERLKQGWENRQAIQV